MQTQLITPEREPVRTYSWADLPPNPAWAMPSFGIGFKAGIGFKSGVHPLNPLANFGSALKAWFEMDETISSTTLYTTPGLFPPAPAVTISGNVQFKQRLQLDITTGASGLGGVQFSYAYGGTTIQTGQLAAATFPLGGPLTGTTVSFPDQLYNTNHHYQNAPITLPDKSGNGRNASAASAALVGQLINGPNGRTALTVISSDTRYNWTYNRVAPGTTRWNVFACIKLNNWSGGKYWCGDGVIASAFTHTGSPKMANAGTIVGADNAGMGTPPSAWKRIWACHSNSSGTGLGNDRLQIGSTTVQSFNCGNPAANSSQYIYAGSALSAGVQISSLYFVEGLLTAQQIATNDAWMVTRQGAVT